MIRPKQKLTLMSPSGEKTSNQGEEVSALTILRDIVKAHPDAPEGLVQAIHDYMADTIYRSMCKGEILVFGDQFTFIPGHLDLGPEDILINVKINFRDGLDKDGLEAPASALDRGPGPIEKELPLGNASVTFGLPPSGLFSCKTRSYVMCGRRSSACAGTTSRPYRRPWRWRSPPIPSSGPRIRRCRRRST